MTISLTDPCGGKQTAGARQAEQPAQQYRIGHGRILARAANPVNETGLCLRVRWPSSGVRASFVSMSKAITIEAAVYDLLASLKENSRDSFTRVIRRYLPRPRETARELLDVYDHAPLPKVN